MIRFFLIVNRSCQTRFARYYQQDAENKDRPTFELEVARACITRKSSQVTFLESISLRMGTTQKDMIDFIF